MNEQREILFQHLEASVRCPVCAQPYHAQDMAILGRRDRVWVVGISCGHCGTQALVFAMVGPRGRLLIGELTPEETDTFRGLGPIHEDEVEKMREYLRNFRGDMRELLGEFEDD